MASILLTGCWLVDESQFPITHPQYAFATTNPKISFDTVIVNGKRWPVRNGTGGITLRGPRINLAGISVVSIDISFKNERESTGTSFNLWMPEDNSASGILVGNLGIEIDDLSHQSLYSEIQYRTDLRIDDCTTGGHPYKGPDLPPAIPLIPRGPVILEQRTKHITLKGTFDIPPTAIPRHPYMICQGSIMTGALIRNPAPPAIIEVRGIHLDIDTDLTFRWCSKGAKCYEK